MFAEAFGLVLLIILIVITWRVVDSIMQAPGTSAALPHVSAPPAAVVGVLDMTMPPVDMSQYYPTSLAGTPAPTTPAPNTSAQVASPVGTLVEGNSYTCPNGPIGAGAVYRAVSNTLRYYPSPQIASSWNPSWSTNIATIDCTGITFGTPMEMKS